MMIIGIGTDIVDISRIEKTIQRFGDAFLRRVFTESERELSKKAGALSAYYAKRFAAKEAFLKALGTGLVTGISWQDMSVLKNSAGRPFMEICGGAEKILSGLLTSGFTPEIHLSLADTDTAAQAMVLIAATKMK